MRIYMAGVYAGTGRGLSTSIHSRITTTASINYPWLLESFHYMNLGMMEAIRRAKKTIFLDSGAYSMFTKKVNVDPNKYAAFIKRHQDIIEVASNLDVIGAGHEQETYDRQKQLEDLCGRGIVMPVHHARDDDKWLQRYLDEGYDYIFLGGMVPESKPVLRQWLDHVWHNFLTNPDGTAKVKVHGFGLTTAELMFRYPWYSVDSTRWVMASRYGMMFLDLKQLDGSIKDYTIDFSDRSNRRYVMYSSHFKCLAPGQQEVVVARLVELEAERIRNPELEKTFKAEFGCEMGFNPVALGKSYGMRDIGNIEFFRRAMARKVDTFIRKQDTLFW
jgi:hypothetical protein